MVMDDLGMPRWQDPNVLLPRNMLKSAMNLVYHVSSGLMRGNVVFALKAAVMTGSCDVDVLLLVSSLSF